MGATKCGGEEEVPRTGLLSSLFGLGDPFDLKRFRLDPVFFRFLRIESSETYADSILKEIKEKLNFLSKNLFRSFSDLYPKISFSDI